MTVQERNLRFKPDLHGGHWQRLALWLGYFCQEGHPDRLGRFARHVTLQARHKHLVPRHPKDGGPFDRHRFLRMKWHGLPGFLEDLRFYLYPDPGMGKYPAIGRVWDEHQKTYFTAVERARQARAEAGRREKERKAADRFTR